MGIRKGSTVTVVWAELSGPGGQNSSLTGLTVTDLNDSYIVINNGSNDTLYPWRSIRSVTATTY